ncbi:MAG: type II secretion system protein [bacterium]|nr:type II secretion system protein [bacterium]
MRARFFRSGFSLLELLVVVAIVGILATLAIVSLSGVVGKARDTKRLHAMSQMGRMLMSSECYLPDAGAGDYDLTEVAAELRTKYPQFAAALGNLPKDPKTGTDAATNYRYTVTADGHCVLYANFENTRETVTLPGLTAPTPNGGTGVLQASSNGPNGTPLYYQVSK